MGARASTVQINQNRYSSTTGQVMDAVKRVSKQVSQSGMAAVKPLARPTTLAKTPAKVAPKKPVARSNRAAMDLHKKTQRSYALMRRAVAKPATGLKKSESVSKVKETSTTAQLPLNSVMANRAKSIVKHAKVRRFGNPLTSAQSSADEPKVITPRPVAKAKARAAQASATAATAPLPSMVTSVSHQQLERLLDHALASANSHKQELRRLSRRGPARFLDSRLSKFIFGVVVVAVVAVASFLVWHYELQASLKVASVQTHIDASAPDYTPSGFSHIGPAKVQNGSVKITYQAQANPAKTYTVTEQPSNQDSSSLAANSSSATQPVQTSQVDGVQVIITSDNKKAMCVGNGIQTTVTNTANLSPADLNNVAKSVCSN